MTGGRQKVKDDFTLFLLRHSSLFDAEYYRKQTGLPKSADAARDYYEGGWRKSDPSPLFRQDLYLEANRDVKAADICPLGHYLLYGKRAGRKLYPGMTVCRYRAHPVRRGIRRRFFEIADHRKIRRNKDARILVVAHIYYEDSLDEILEYLKNLRPYTWDLVVTTTAERDTARIEERVHRFKPDAEIRVTENRGFDIAPYLEAVRSRDLSQYDLVIKVQSKQLFDPEGRETGSLYFRGRDWFLYLFESTLGAAKLHSNIDRIRRDPEIRLIAARNLLCRDTESRQRLTVYRLREKGLDLPKDYVFAAGSCFCARSDAAEAMSVLDPDWFEASDRGQFTFAHTAERFLTGSIPPAGQLGVRVCTLRRLHSAGIHRHQKNRRQRALNRRLAALDRTAMESGSPEKAPGRLTFAFAVTEAGDRAVAGDYFTALELAEALEKRGCSVRFLEQTDVEKPWEYVGRDVDVLVSMLQFYPLDRMYAVSDHLITVGWARNWFDQWMENPDTARYDLLLASSETARQEMEAVLGRGVGLFPIGTNPARFGADAPSGSPVSPEAEALYSCDYCFTGNYFGIRREIEDELAPAELPWRFKIFGDGWQNHPSLSGYACGHLAYEEMPEVYRRAKIVLDDATASTRVTGAVNSRVYDALAAGCLVLSNNERGARETFRGMLPTFHDQASLREQLERYLSDDALRKATVEKLQRFVAENHTYEIRAEQLLSTLPDL